MKEPKKTKALWAILTALLICGCLVGFAAVRGLMENYDLSYNIMDGDFQNYNPVRRLLAGQIPYRQFMVYLGAGELYSVAAVLALIGNSFGHSVFAAAMLTWLVFELLIFAAALTVFQKPKAAGWVTLGLSAACAGLLPLGGALKQWLFIAASTGNSARMLRAGNIPLAVVIAVGSVLLWEHAGARPLTKKSPLHPALLVPLFAGALVPWSNDAGAGMYVGISLAYGFVLLKRNGKDLARTAAQVAGYILVSCVGLAGSILLVTWGHPGSWLKATLGTGAYQRWYYSQTEKTALFHLTDYRPTAAFWLLLVLAAGFGAAFFLAKTRAQELRLVGSMALCVSVVVWEFFYAFGSGKRSVTTGGCVLLLPVLLAVWGLYLLSRLPSRKAKTILCGLTACFALGVLILGAKTQVLNRLGGHEGLTHQPQLGGWIGDQGEKLEKELALSAGQPVFSTYAGGLETLTGQYQPTGTDYIIHVLGDTQRREYLERFRAGGFGYVVTPAFKVTVYETWSRNANWWFYRELYRYWQPMGNSFNCGGMHILWQPTGDNALDEPLTLTVEQESPRTVVLTVTAEDPDFSGIADVTLRYSAHSGSLNTVIVADPVTEKQLEQVQGREVLLDWNLDPGGDTAQVPISMEKGVGVLRLEAYPRTDAVLTVESAVVGAATPNWQYWNE